MGLVSTEFRPLFGKVLTVVIGATCVAGAIWSVWGDGLRALLQVVPWLALFAGACWAMFWQPRVIVDDGGVQLVNVLRTIHVPWPAIQAIDTKFALTLITAYGRFVAWSAPAPGAKSAVRATRGDVRRIPDSAWAADGIRPGDLPDTPSGSAALLIRTRWQRLRDDGFLDDPQLEHERVPVRWHWRTLAIGAALLAVGLIGLAV